MFRRDSIAIEVGLSLFLAALAACSETDRKLHEIQSGKYDAVVVKDEQGMYWAIPTAGIDRVDGNRLAVKARTVLAGGEGSGPPDTVEGEMSARLLDLLKKADVTGFGATSISVEGNGYTISGKIELTAQPREIVVEKVLRTEEKP